MMDGTPRISIVTASYNQGQYIAETIESVLSQGYSNLEHIVVDGGSTDDTPAVLARYAHLRLVSEFDQSQAAAINKGFRLASGDIWCFLNSDDTLLPGALARVAREIDPACGRHVIMGRARFVDEHGRFTGIEHPSHFESHARVLEIWKGHMIPQPAVFWTPDVWRACGSLDEQLGSAWIDYDLFCRFSKKYRFHFVDQVLATYRLHAGSKTQSSSEARRLEECIQIGRRYWGRHWSPSYWRLAFSLASYRYDRPGRARRWLAHAREAWRQGRALQTLAYGVLGVLLAPEVAFYVALYPLLREPVRGAVRKLLDRLDRSRGLHPRTAVYLDHTELWWDGWAGPRLVLSREARVEVQAIRIRGQADLKYIVRPLLLTVLVEGQEVGQGLVARSGEFRLDFSLQPPLAPGVYEVEVQANTWFVLHRYLRNGDYRPLAWRVQTVDLLNGEV